MLTRRPHDLVRHVPSRQAVAQHLDDALTQRVVRHKAAPALLVSPGKRAAPVLEIHYEAVHHLVQQFDDAVELRRSRTHAPEGSMVASDPHPKVRRFTPHDLRSPMRSHMHALGVLGTSPKCA